MKPAIPPKQLKHNHSFQEHYAQIYLSTQPIQYKGRERIERTSGKGRMGEKDSQINYTEINHFMTEQLQHMIEQRRIEKGLSSRMFADITDSKSLEYLVSFYCI